MLHRMVWMQIAVVAVIVQVSNGAGYSQVINPGDRILADITCLLKNGDIIMTTDEALANNEAQHKSDIFLPFKEYGPLDIMAGAEPEKPPVLMLLDRGFEGAVTSWLQKTVVGMKEGEAKRLEMTASVPEGLPDNERYLSLSRQMKRKLKQRIPLEAFRKIVGKDPEIGMMHDFSPELKCVVTAFDQEGVDTRLIVEDGRKVSTPWGPGTLKILDEETYAVEVNPRVGQLIRTAHLVGRISGVKEDTFIIDYGNPLGGETICCDIEIMEVKKEKNLSEGIEGGS